MLDRNPAPVDKLVALSQGANFPPSSVPPLDSVESAKAEAYIRAHPDFTAYELLLALRRQFPESFDRIPDPTKARVLCSARSCTDHCASDWGYLEPRGGGEGQAAVALVGTGRIAIPLLIPLLDDRTPLHFLMGKLRQANLEKYEPRRADFAYRYLCQILGLDPVFDAEPSHRDERIQSLKEELTAPNRKHGPGPGKVGPK
jgi:hypothetical protein